MKRDSIPTELIELLAATDVLFEPFRAWREEGGNRQAVAILAARTTFATRGLPISAGGGTARERKQRERQLDALQKSHKVVFGRQKGKRAFWKLRDDVDWQLRRMCQWHDWPEVSALLAAVQAHTLTGHTNNGYVPDWAIASIDTTTAPDKWRQALVDMEWVALPALVRGWLHAWSDCYGSNGYRITDAGRRILTNPEEPSVRWPKFASAASDVYIEALKAARQALPTLPATTNSCAIPLSAGCWPRLESRAPIPSLFTDTVRGKVRPAAELRKAIKQ